MRGTFITFEGIDGGGKSTQLRLLAERLEKLGFDVTKTLEPGGTRLGKRLRAVFLETEEAVDPVAELLLFAADRAQHVNTLIEPALAAGKIVISDRYADATFAYQGAGRGFSPDLIKTVTGIATGGLKPDLTVLFDLPIETGLTRTNKRHDEGDLKNRMDEENAGFYKRVRDAYLESAQREPQRFLVVDATLSVEAIQERVFAEVSRFLAERRQTKIAL